MNEPRRHHYIPKFYLSKWGNSKGRVMCYLWDQGKLKGLDLDPVSTGVQRDLYRLSHVPREVEQSFEKYVASDVDGRASNALRTITTSGVEELSDDEREAWAQFLVSLPIRNPEAIADIQKTSSEHTFEKAYAMAVEQYPEWDAEFDLRKELEESIDEDRLTRFLHSNYGMLIIRELMLNPQYYELLMKLHWWTLNFDRSDFSLLTCDRPYMVLRPLSHPRGLAYVPIGPRLGFFLSPDKNKKRQLGRVAVSQLAKKMNRFQIGMAIRFVYAVDSQHSKFIENHFRPVQASNE